MTAVEKAKDLVTTFYNVPNPIEGEGLSNWAIYNKDAAKQCALVAVNEIIEENKNIAHNYVDDFRLLYWQAVKEEIHNV